MISTEDLGYSKTCSHLVPQMLTDAHRNKKQSSLNFCTNMFQEMWASCGNVSQGRKPGSIILNLNPQKINGMAPGLSIARN